MAWDADIEEEQARLEAQGKKLQPRFDAGTLPCCLSVPGLWPASCPGRVAVTWVFHNPYCRECADELVELHRSMNGPKKATP